MVNASNRARLLAPLAIAALLAAACDDDSKDTDINAAQRDDAGTTDAGGESKPPAQSDDPTQVTLKDGKLEGDVMGESVRFLKIPYAKPPVGDLRWKAPVSNASW